jgi:ankyrin repeat protein
MPYHTRFQHYGEIFAYFLLTHLLRLGSMKSNIQTSQNNGRYLDLNAILRYYYNLRKSLCMMVITMLNDLITQVTHNNKLFVELLLNFYLDGNAVERQRIEEILLENKQEDLGHRIVENLRQIAASKGL